MEQRENFTTRFGFLLATIGGAIGIANLISFPPLLHKHGVLFIVAYLFFTLVIGIPIMTAEIALGRHTASSPVNAYQKIGGKRWGLLGRMNLVCCFVLFAVFTILFAWTARYFVGYATGGVPKDFRQYVSVSWKEIAFVGAVLIGVNVFVVGMGIQKGIERISKLLLPVFALSLLFFSARNFLDFPEIKLSISEVFSRFPNGWEGWSALLSDALGQAFFSLSLGAGAMLTYGSYLSKAESIGRLANIIVQTDTAVALVCCLFVLPLGLDYKLGESPLFLFVTLSDYFNGLPYSNLLGGIFFLCLSFVVLTMTVSVLEPVVSFGLEKLNRRRMSVAFFVGVGAFFCFVPLVLSFGASPFWSNFILSGGEQTSKSFFDVVFDVFINIALPVGGLLMCVFVNRVWGLDGLVKEVSGLAATSRNDWFEGFIKFCLQYLTPTLLFVLLVMKVVQFAKGLI